MQLLLCCLLSSREDESCCTAFSHHSRINGSRNSRACYLAVSDVFALTVVVLISERLLSGIGI